ncbi:MAG: hypothetical protein A4E34_00858 [Methanoregula sp. PtaU1.Bin006]|nr:MAG: hypothetical protein A4E33_02022 [Methanoregula sp. PtaB.Bin085]OPY35330.1 MAG: hypothetical protein A4E34_00858 [Methanoregula sp. PtaU1.Bin006]
MYSPGAMADRFRDDRAQRDFPAVFMIPAATPAGAFKAAITTAGQDFTGIARVADSGVRNRPR